MIYKTLKLPYRLIYITVNKRTETKNEMHKKLITTSLVYGIECMIGLETQTSVSCSDENWDGMIGILL